MTDPAADAATPGRYEFTCAGCGDHVFSFGFSVSPEPRRCATCRWLDGIPDGTVRARMRWFLQDHGGLPPDAARERARAAYHDPACVARQCDHCGHWYTGPAVYCSLACAEADAE